MKELLEYTVEADGKIPQMEAVKIREIHKKYSGKFLRLIVTNERTRTNPQNNWLHAVIELITNFLRTTAKESGDENYYTINEETTKLWIKQKFLGYEEINGERQLRKTSKLKTFECNELFENLQRYFAPLGLDIPSPNEKDYRIINKKSEQ